MLTLPADGTNYAHLLSLKDKVRGNLKIFFLISGSKLYNLAT